MNKRLHFASNLIPLIISEEKTTTWRLWDEKNLGVGDVVDFLESGTEKHFATGELVNVVEKRMREIVKDNEANIGHETYADNYKAYSDYYGRDVTPETLGKVIKFKILKIRQRLF